MGEVHFKGKDWDDRERKFDRIDEAKYEGRNEPTTGAGA